MGGRCLLDGVAMDSSAKLNPALWRMLRVEKGVDALIDSGKARRAGEQARRRDSLSVQVPKALLPCHVRLIGGIEGWAAQQRRLPCPVRRT